MIKRAAILSIIIFFINTNANAQYREDYLKNGFEVTEEVVFDIGNGYVMDDYIMELVFKH